MSAWRWSTRKEAQVAGWFSRRHETDKENRDARERYAQTRGREARRRRAEARR